VVTGETAAVKPALLAPAATVTVAGTVTALLLLLRFTVKPPEPAEELKETTQESIAEPVIELRAQLRELSAAGVATTPVPLRPTSNAEPDEELLVKASWPVEAPAEEGSNCTPIAAVCPGANVTGKPSPDTENPDPDTVGMLTVTGSVPVDVRVSDLLDADPRVTLPNETFDGLMLSPGAAAPS
jgi:hypothetical protein